MKLVDNNSTCTYCRAIQEMLVNSLKFELLSPCFSSFCLTWRDILLVYKSIFPVCPLGPSYNSL